MAVTAKGRKREQTEMSQTAGGREAAVWGGAAGEADLQLKLSHGQEHLKESAQNTNL